MRRAAVWSTLLLVWAPAAARAQTIGGVVLEDSTRMPVTDATVTIIPVDTTGERGATTDSVGHFHVALAAAGKFVLRVTHPSYTTLLTDTVDVARGEAVTLELHVGRNAIPLKPLVVTARVDARLREFRERMTHGTGFGRFLTREDIERRPGARLTDLLRGISGVRIVPIAPCGGCSPSEVVYMRGITENCTPTVLMDGLITPQDAGFPLDALISPEMLEGIEIYVDPAGVPASLNTTTNSCGVIALWTARPTGKVPFWLKVVVAGGAALLVTVLMIFR